MVEDWGGPCLMCLVSRTNRQTSYNVAGCRLIAAHPVLGLEANEVEHQSAWPCSRLGHYICGSGKI